MKFVKMFLALIGLAVLFVFVRDNTEPVTVEFWGYATPEIELFLVLIITFVLGMIAASFGSTMKIIKLKRQLKSAGGVEGASKKEVPKKEKGKNKKRATAESTKPHSSVENGPAMSTSSVTTDTAPAHNGATDIGYHADVSERTDTQGSAPLQKSDVLDAQLEDESSPQTSDTDDGESASPDRVIALGANEPDAEQTDRK